MKLLFSNVNETSMNSSDNSTDSSEGSPTGGGGAGGQFEGPNLEVESLLPSVVSQSIVCCCCMLRCCCMLHICCMFDHDHVYCMFAKCSTACCCILLCFTACLHVLLHACFVLLHVHVVLSSDQSVNWEFWKYRGYFMGPHCVYISCCS